jgi:hypothetical protein
VVGPATVVVEDEESETELGAGNEAKALGAAVEEPVATTSPKTKLANNDDLPTRAALFAWLGT